jgi:hypothetical protein
MTSEFTRTVYGKSLSGGSTASNAFSARVPAKWYKSKLNARRSKTASGRDRRMEKGVALRGHLKAVICDRRMEKGVTLRGHLKASICAKWTRIFRYHILLKIQYKQIH